jgi:hypothetical protein
LTHLALHIGPWVPNIGVFNDILACRTLMVLVLIVDRQILSTIVDARSLYDMLRVQSAGRPQVYVAWPRPGSVRQQWLESVEGHYDLWERAVEDTKEWTASRT